MLFTTKLGRVIAKLVEPLTQSNVYVATRSHPHIETSSSPTCDASMTYALPTGTSQPNSLDVDTETNGSAFITQTQETSLTDYLENLTEQEKLRMNKFLQYKYGIIRAVQ